MVVMGVGGFRCITAKRQEVALKLEGRGGESSSVRANFFFVLKMKKRKYSTIIFKNMAVFQFFGGLIEK